MILFITFAYALIDFMMIDQYDDQKKALLLVFGFQLSLFNKYL